MISIISAHLDDFIPSWHNPGVHVRNHILTLVTEGQLTYRLDNQIITAYKGDLMFIPSGTHRESYNDGELLHQKVAVLFQVSAPLGLPLLERAEISRISVRALDYYRDRFLMLYKLFLEKLDYYELMGAGILLELLGHLQRDLSAPALPRRKQQHATVLEQFIVQHFREPLMIEQLARRIDRSPNYTLTLFKEATGMTPVEYQHQLRVNTASDLLRQTNLTIAAIAEHLGYYDASSFYKMFRKKTGTSPSAFRASLPRAD